MGVSICQVGLAVMDVLQTDLLALDLEELQMDFKGLVTALSPIDVLPRYEVLSQHAPSVKSLIILSIHTPP